MKYETLSDEEHTKKHFPSTNSIRGFLRSLVSGIPWSERCEGEETLTLRAPSGTAMRVDNANGRTRIIGEDRESIEIHVHKAARAESQEHAAKLVHDIRILHRENASGTLDIEVEIPGRWNRKGKANLEILVPREIEASVTASNGRICIAGLRAPIHLHSSNGPVRVNDVIGDIEIHTANAKVSTENTCGRMLARSSNGKIELRQHRGSVDASTSNGTIRCDLQEMDAQGCVLVTSNGRISLDLPETVDADVHLRVDNGLIRCTRQLQHANQERKGRLKGRLGSGGTTIRLRASNGTINLR